MGLFGGGKRAKQTPSSVLVGDIGGTNARFAIADSGNSGRPALRNIEILRSSDYASLGAAIGAYLKRAGAKAPDRAAIAVAGPVKDGAVEMTNLPWRISEEELKRSGFRQARLVNDFEALAVAAGILCPDDLVPVGSTGSYDGRQSVAIVGAGTGLGISARVKREGVSVIVASEGGHAGFAPADQQQSDVLRALSRRFGRVSNERLLSGPGLLNIYEAMCETSGVEKSCGTPAEIVNLASQGVKPCGEAVEMFCCIMGSVAGDVALMFGAGGGVLLTGGVTMSIRPFLGKSGFRGYFEAKGRLSAYLKVIPTFLLVLEYAALLGCAQVAAGNAAVTAKH
jgi:glucokinase